MLLKLIRGMLTCIYPMSYMNVYLKKDMANFRKTWNAKFPRTRLSTVISGVTDESIIAQKFSHFFQQANDTDDSVPCDKIAVELQQYVDGANISELKLLDVETVCKCLSQMKKGKAPAVDGIETEHLLYMLIPTIV